MSDRLLLCMTTVATYMLSITWHVPHSAAQSNNSLEATHAATILQKHCSRCHGASNSPNLNLLDLNNREGMLKKRQIVPGSPELSRIYVRTALSPLDPMPPKSAKDDLSAAEKAVLKAWIANGAQPEQRPPDSGGAMEKFITDAEMLRRMAADLSTIARPDRRFMRYFYLTHLANAGASDADLKSYRAGFSRLINSLSWQRVIAVPHSVDEAGMILRIDMREYAWTDAIWQRLRAAYPYAVTSQAKTAQTIYQQTACELPYVRMDWFIANAALPPLYHDLLDMPQTAKELELILRVDIEKNLQQRNVRRSGFSESGVSRNNRIVERHITDYGAYWRSYDFSANSGRQNIFENPLSFEEAGGEIIFNLPNGLQGYMLVNGVGKRIDTAPIDIVSNKQNSHDPVVRNGLTCMSCHALGMQRFDDRADQLRQVILTAPNQLNDINRATAMAIYSEKQEIARLLDADAARFANAVKAAGSELEREDPTVTLAAKFNQPVSISLAAAELGMTESLFQEKLNDSARLGALRGLLKTAGGVIKRDAWEEYFGDAVRELAHGDFRRPTAARSRFTVQIKGAQYGTSGPTEVLSATFKEPDGCISGGLYSGLVVVNVTGGGQSSGTAYSDAFYLFSGADIKAPKNDSMHQLTFGTETPSTGPSHNAKRRIVGGLPPYDASHSYTFVLDTGLTTPGKLHFGVSDTGYDDNTGAYTIQIAQLSPVR